MVVGKMLQGAFSLPQGNFRNIDFGRITNLYLSHCFCTVLGELFKRQSAVVRERQLSLDYWNIL